MPSEYSIWLLPRDDDGAMLSDLIAELAPAFCGCSFAPHVTVQGDLDAELPALQRMLDRLAGETPPLRLKVRAVQSTGHFFRCLYLRFDDDATFERLQALAREFSGTDCGLSPYAHLSLAYGDPNETMQAARCEELSPRVVGRHIALDRVAVYRSSKDVAIADWRECAVRPLGA